MNSEEVKAQEEARYWFCLNDVADFVLIHGSDKVVYDLLDLVNQRKRVDRAKQVKMDFSDVPF